MAQLTGSGPGNGTNYAMIDSSAGINDGRLWVLNGDGLQIAKGNISGYNGLHKFGRNPDIGTASGFEAIWNGGGDYTGFNATSAEVLEIFSDNSEDTSGTGTGAFTMTLPRLLDGNFIESLGETVELNGTNSVYTSGAYIRCSRATINIAGTSGINVGEITVRQSGTVANVMAVMPATYNQTMIACDTIPSGTTGFLTTWFASLSAKKTGISNIRLVVRPSGGVFNVKEEFAIATVGNSYVQREYTVPKNSLFAMTDIKIMADSNVNNQGIAAGFDIILVDN